MRPSGASDPSVLVLASLAERPRHGYAITADVREMAGVRLGPGTLYGVLARLEDRGLIEALPSDDRRKPYRLTGDGARVLEEELRAQERVAHTGLSRLASSRLAAEGSA